MLGPGLPARQRLRIAMGFSFRKLRNVFFSTAEISSQQYTRQALVGLLSRGGAASWSAQKGLHGAGSGALGSKAVRPESSAGSPRGEGT